MYDEEHATRLIEDIRRLAEELYGMVADTRPLFTNDPLDEIEVIKREYGSVDDLLSRLEETASQLKEKIDEFESINSELPVGFPSGEYLEAKKIYSMYEREITPERIEVLKKFEEVYPILREMREKGIQTDISSLDSMSSADIEKYRDLEPLLDAYERVHNSASEITTFVDSLYQVDDLENWPEYERIYSESQTIIPSIFRENHPDLYDIVTNPTSSELYYAPYTDEELDYMFNSAWADEDEDYDEVDEDTANAECRDRAGQIVQKLENMREKYRRMKEQHDNIIAALESALQEVDGYRDEAIQRLQPEIEQLVDEIMKTADEEYIQYLNNNFRELFIAANSGDPLRETLAREAFGKIYALTGVRIDPDSMRVLDSGDSKNFVRDFVQKHVERIIEGVIYDWKDNMRSTMLELSRLSQEKYDRILEALDEAINDMDRVTSSDYDACENLHRATMEINDKLRPLLSS